eukprot:gene9701-43925_t
MPRRCFKWHEGQDMADGPQCHNWALLQACRGSAKQHRVCSGCGNLRGMALDIDAV